ncbi:MAG: efflux RND transporter periplasmic adaptor subunit [Nitrospirota bacterium]
MKKFIAFIVLIAIVAGGYMYREDIENYINDLKNGTTNEKLVRNKELLLRELPPKEVEIFELGKDKITLNFTKTGTASASSTTHVSPQTTGLITKVYVEVGDNVEKNGILMTLGDSLSTDIADQQYLAAKAGLEAANSTLSLTKKINLESLDSAQLGIEAAKNSLENSKDTKIATNSLTSVQLDSAQLAVELAEDAYDDLKDDYNDAKDALEDLEDDYDDLQEEQPEAVDALKQLAAAIAQAEAQVDALKSAKDNTKDGIEQADLGLEQTKKSLALQLDQLGFAIQATSTQYESTVNQLETLQLSTKLQELGIESQITQANSAYEIAKISKKYQDVRSPIDGTVTAISAEENNFASPGQVLVTIENLDKFTIKTSLNEDEAELVKAGDKVEIEGKTGKIVSISPTLNQMTKKIDIEIEIDKTSKINSGSFVKISFSPSPKKNIFVPLNSIQLTPTGKIVNVIDNNYVVQYKEVETGQIIGNFIEITDGLKGNEKIIKTTTIYVEEGEKVALAN